MELRDQILKASVELIEREGLGALSMREVARRAGVSHQAPYHHFADRPAILAAIAGDGFRQLSEALERALTAPKLDALARLDAGGRAYVRFAVTHRAHFRVMFRPELVDLSNYPDAKEAAQHAFEQLRALVAGSVGQGAISPASAEGTVILSWAFVHGLASLAIDGPLAKAADDEKDEEKMIDAAFAAYQKFLRGPQPTSSKRKKKKL